MGLLPYNLNFLVILQIGRETQTGLVTEEPGPDFGVGLMSLLGSVLVFDLLFTASHPACRYHLLVNISPFTMKRAMPHFSEKNKTILDI